MTREELIEELTDIYKIALDDTYGRDYIHRCLVTALLEYINDDEIKHLIDDTYEMM